MAIMYYTTDSDSVIYYAATNAQGDVLALYTGGGIQSVTYEYDSWGNLISMTDTTSVGIGSINPIRYRGYYFDSETGLYYLQSRYYDPQVGRFINGDAQVSSVGGDIRGYNLFVYCFNNPICFIDSTGNWPSWGQIFTAVATVAVAAVVVTAVVASAGAVGIAAGVAAASIGATGTVVSTAMTIGTVGTYAVATGIGACALSNTGEILTGTNVIRDGLFWGKHTVYDDVQLALGVASGAAMLIGEINPGVSERAASPQKNAKVMHSIPNKYTPRSSIDKLYKGKPGEFLRQYYGFRGNRSLRIDFTEHSPGSGHKNPHIHIMRK